jgi:hypothetical protein
MALFIQLIIRTFQLVFSAGTMSFSYNKSANNVFQPAYQYSRRGQYPIKSFFQIKNITLIDIFSL